MMTTTTAVTVPHLSPRRSIRLGFSRIGYEIKTYFRQGDTLFFTFLFPLLLLAIFSVAFSSMTFGSPGHTVSSGTYYLPAMLAAGILLSGVQNLGIDIAAERSDGTLKRLGGTPLPLFSYFIGKFGQVLVTGILQAALLIVVGHFVFGAELPTDTGSWLTLLWIFVLGIATSAVLGIAVSALPRSGKSAASVIVPIGLVLQFISGVYIQFTVLPVWLQDIASVFPLKWMAQGMRAVFLPADFAAAEPGGTWNLGWVAVILSAWLVVGFVFCRFTFRWIRKR